MVLKMAFVLEIMLFVFEKFSTTPAEFLHETKANTTLSQ
jgi:hypothetical protein